MGSTARLEPTSRSGGRPAAVGDTHRLGSFFRDLPLFWKLLVPFLALIILLGLVGGFLIVRDLSARAQSTLDQDLLRRSLEVRSFVHDRELYLLEAVNFASNLEGMAEAIAAHDPDAATKLLRSVLALKADLNLLVVTDADGTALSEFTDYAPGDGARPGIGGDWSGHAIVRRAIRGPEGRKSSGFLQVADRTTLTIAAPVCSTSSGCSPAGVAMVGVGIKELATEAGALGTSGDAAWTVAVYNAGGELLDGSGPATPRLEPSDRTSASLVRVKQQIGSSDVATLLAPFEVQGRRVGTLGVSVPVGPAFSSVRGTAWRLGLLLLAALAGIVGIGAALSRFILKQVRSLVATNRGLGGGELSARAPVMSGDELGELATGVNQMAEQLQASVETLELRVEQRTQEVQRLLRERTDFFSAASHDFRTPLAVILRQADVLRAPAYADDAKRGVAAGRLTEAGEHLLVLVNDILSMAEAESGHVEVQLEDVHLPGVIDELRGTIDGLARASDVKVAIQTDGDLPPVRADRARLREVILNLVDNAVKYTPSGGKILLSSAARNGHVEVSVSDSGVGIPADVGTRIFEPFYRVKGTTPQRGQASSGLGLAVAKRLVEAHGGEISYERGPKTGTTFTFTLMAARSSGPRAKRSTKRLRDGD